MISYFEIEVESAKAGVSTETIEKDYHLDWYLAGLASKKFFPRFAFYGGTAIKKMFIPNHRFSEDLDLISEKMLTVEALQEKLAPVHPWLEKEANLFCSLRPEEVQTAGTQTRFLVHYRGFSQIAGTKRFLLDFAQGIEELPKPVPCKLLTGYSDLTGRRIQIQALPLEILCAEKLAMIVDRKRKEPRDIYDLWAVLRDVKKFEKSLFLSRFRKALGYAVDFSIIRASFRDPDFHRAWDMRLKHQVPRLPDFNLALFELMNPLENLFINH